MDKEIWIDDEKGYAELRYTWRKKVAGLFKVRVNTLAAMTPIERNRAQTLSEIAEKLERTREIFAARRKNRRDIYMARIKAMQTKPSYKTK